MNGRGLARRQGRARAAGRACAERRRAARRNPRYAGPARTVALRPHPVRTGHAGRHARGSRAATRVSTFASSAQSCSSPQVDPNGGASAAGVRPGWRLLSLDAMPVSELLSRLPEAMPARLRQVEVWRMVETRLRGPQGSLASLMFDDGRQDVGIAVERRAEPGQPATVGNLPTMYVRVESEERRTAHGATAGVIRFNVWMPGVDPLFQQAVDKFRKADGIVVDLRGNPGGLAAMIMGISGHFLTERKPLGTMKTRDERAEVRGEPAARQRCRPARRALCRAGRHPRRRDDRKRVGVLRRRHAGARARPRVRSDVDGPGASGVLRQAAER